MARMFLPEKLIDQKRRGLAIAREDINQLVHGIANGSVTDAQLGAFTMAVRFQGMDPSEQTSLTLAMRDSGSVLKWEGLDGPVLDKHSTGGVGDGVSLALAPMIAACGGYIPMISGRGLGHTGGTLDKLESIPGFNVQMNLDRFRDVVRRTGMAMVGQGPDLAPADGRMYAIRDVTATVESIPLIVSSILAKKLAEGLDGLVLDVKTGNGAFMSKRDKSRNLAQSLCATASRAGTKCSALITDMSQPLGWSAGNLLELNEAIDFLTGARRNPRLEEVTLGLATELLILGGLSANSREGRKHLMQALDSGSAAEKFARAVAEQGGPADLLQRRDKFLLPAPLIRPVQADKAGWISAIDTRELGMAVLRMGGGRLHVEDTIDPRVGLAELCSVGDYVERGQALCVIHADNEQDWQVGAERVINALRISPQECAALPAIYEYVTGEQAGT
jgi:thymidine phosphorylase